MPVHSASTHFAIWAKTARKAGDDRYHPLICHLIDVACVARALWDRVLPATLRERVADGLGLEDQWHAAAWVSYLAGLHDIGKASPGFQKKHPAGSDRVRAAGYSVPIEPTDVGHGTVSALALQDLLVDPAFGGLSSRLVNRFVAGAIGGHHGVFPSGKEVSCADVEDVRGASDWADARRDLAELLAAHTGIGDLPSPTTMDAGTATIIAGLTSVLDWIGSDERFFRYAATDGRWSANLDIDMYARESHQSALRALSDLGWLDWTPSTARLTLTELFPFITDARPVQQAVAELPDIPASPGIVIIEVPMGEGKTEAAFYLADQWCSVIGQNGCYVAMPTMATSNQMFGRMREFLARRYPTATTNLQLLHSQAALTVDYEAREHTQRLAVEPTEVHDDREGRSNGQIRAREWFTRRKRGLLAPFGVGTVDQSLLAILSTPHHFVRLFGLAGKTVIFDEVHAYDIYMTTLFERLMTWLGALGSSVVILSATLPDQRRRQLLTAYADGAGISTPALEQQADYPRVSWINAGGGDVLQVGTSDDVRRALRIDWIDDADGSAGSWAGLVEWLGRALSSGGCAAVICNTVRHAQEVYQALRPTFCGVADDGEPELDLLHARFPFEARDAREKRALRRFGKPGGEVVDEDGSKVSVQRPRRAMLVATQIIEQSLDLDFDLMVSEVAPVDLLLQRSGRLQRHRRRARPEGLEHPTLWLLRPAVSDGIPAFRGGTRFVYDPHLLFRTWLSLRDLKTIRIPEDIGWLVESVYDPDCEPPDHLSESQREHWRDTRVKHEESLRIDAEQARVREIPDPRHCERIAALTQHFRAEDSPEIHQAHQALTRLTGPSVSLICLYETLGGLGLDAEGKEVLDPNQTPDTALARRLLGRSVTVSTSGVTNRLLEVEPPQSWRRSSLLRHHRPAAFGPDGRATLGGVKLRLDPELGLLIEGREDG